MDEGKLDALNKMLKYCKNSAFYRNKLPDEPLASMDQLKRLPLTTKEDLRENSPFGFVCVPERELYQYHESFGTTGVPAATWLTGEDFYEQVYSVNEGGIDFSEKDIVLIRFPYAISTVAHFVQAAAHSKNACVIAAGSRTPVSPFPRIVNLLKKLNVTVLASMPMQAVLIAEAAEILGLKPDKDFPALRMLYTAGELLTPQRRRVLEKIWGVPVSDNYGMTETGPLAVDCKYGTLHPFEERFIFEVLDESLKTEVKPGETGYLVLTTLRRKGTPLVRYLTDDRASLEEKPCKCGKHVALKVRGRIQDTVKCGNLLLDLQDIAEIVSHLPCQRFWIAGPEGQTLKIVAEEEQKGDSVDSGTLRALEGKYKIGLKADIVPKGALHDRNELVSNGSAGKPRYIFSAEEIKQKIYLFT